MVRKLVVVLLSGIFCLLGVTSALAVEYNEAPMLRAKVAAGELPPVEERLPEEPLVVVPIEEIGQYGGILRRAQPPEDHGAFYNYNISERIIAFPPPYDKVVPNVVKGYEVSEDNKTFTFYLRKGMKWSDGVPFTADDFMFWWEDIMLNKEFTPGLSPDLSIGGEPGKLEKIDDYTVRWTFAAPYGSFVTIMSSSLWSSASRQWAPKHYLKQFHPKYTAMDEINKSMKKGNFDTWMDLFKAKNHFYGGNPELPSLLAWVPIDEWGGVLQRWVRNPYYWKIDTEGNQLPYIDGVHRSITTDTEAILLKVLAGEIDWQFVNVASALNYPIIMQNREKGDYTVIPCVPLGLSTTFWFNFFVEDPVLRKLFRNKQFRIALSIALDREEINELVYQGQGKIKQMVAEDGMPWYSEERAKLYTEYDLKKANEILDEIGLEWDKNHEYRLRSDGERLGMIINPYQGLETDDQEAAELAKIYWKELGIEVVVKPLLAQLWYATVSSFTHDACIYTGAGGSLDIGPLGSFWLFPLGAYSYWGGKWGLWYETDGKAGEEPPEDVVRLHDLHQELMATSSIEEYNSIMEEVMTIRMDNFWEINIMEKPAISYFYVASNKLGNTPTLETGIRIIRNVALIHPAQFFFKN